MNKIIDNIKSGNYEVVDNQGVSVTGHFTQCLEKEFADLEAKLAEKDKEIKQLKQQLHDLPKKIMEEIKLQLFNHFKVKNIEEYEKLPLIDSLFTADTVIEILDTILKSMERKNEESF